MLVRELLISLSTFLASIDAVDLLLLFVAMLVELRLGVSAACLMSQNCSDMLFRRRGRSGIE